MRLFMKLTWTVQSRAAGYFVCEETTGGGDAMNGEVLIGPFSTRDEAEAVLAYRHREMGEFFTHVRGQIERTKVKVQRAA